MTDILSRNYWIPVVTVEARWTTRLDLYPKIRGAGSGTHQWIIVISKQLDVIPNYSFYLEFIRVWIKKKKWSCFIMVMLYNLTVIPVICACVCVCLCVSRLSGEPGHSMISEGVLFSFKRCAVPHLMLCRWTVPKINRSKDLHTYQLHFMEKLLRRTRPFHANYRRACSATCDVHEISRTQAHTPIKLKLNELTNILITSCITGTGSSNCTSNNNYNIPLIQHHWSFSRKLTVE